MFDEEMPESQIIQLDVNPSLAAGIRVRVVSETGLDSDENLTLSATCGFFSEGETWELPLQVEDARALWDLLHGFEFEDAESDLIGLDGTSYSLTIRTDRIDATMDWWETIPEEWVGPRKLADRLLCLAGPKADEFRR